ncbi:MAG TPA: hypothetical protein VMI56_12170 [Reyranella sp.]|nr:hypothetical protein [Reyranella sp.]
MTNLSSRTLAVVVATAFVALPAWAQTSSSEAPTGLALPPLAGPLMAPTDTHARSAHHGLKLDQPAASQDSGTPAVQPATTLASAAPSSSSPLMGAGPLDMSRAALGGNAMMTGTR